MEECIFYREWLPLPKDQFNILAMIATCGERFEGNFTDICHFLSVTPQSRNRTKIREALIKLKTGCWIGWEQDGRTQILTVNQKATKIAIPRDWVLSVIHHDYTSEKVARAQVLKLFIWIVYNKGDLTTNQEIALALGVSESTICSAKNVLEKEFEIITKRKVSDKIFENLFIVRGQVLEACAWWKDIAN